VSTSTAYAKRAIAHPKSLTSHDAQPTVLIDVKATRVRRVVRDHLREGEERGERYDCFVGARILDHWSVVTAAGHRPSPAVWEWNHDVPVSRPGSSACRAGCLGDADGHKFPEIGVRRLRSAARIKGPAVVE